MTSALSFIGAMFFAASMWLGYEAVIFDVGVDGIVNLSLMQVQTSILSLAAALFLGGCVFIVGACVVHAIDRRPV